MKLTRHNGRAGKHGIYNPKHNDRRFDLENSEHIASERTAKNIYWNIYLGLDTPDLRGFRKRNDVSFDEVERMYYSEHYQDYIAAQNQRNEKNRHPERNRTVEDLLSNRQTCPEETIYQIGNFDETVSPETLYHIAEIFFGILEERYGEYYHSLNWALHVDEGTPHIHERHVFDCENKYGEICPQQEKALEKMGIPLPNPEAKRSKNNNRKMMFDSMCRDLLMNICENKSLYLDKAPVYGGREYLEKQDYILFRQKEKMAAQEQRMEELTMKIEDVEALIDEVADIAYDKAVEVVTETVKVETHKEDIKLVEQSKAWVLAPERKASKKEIEYSAKRLDGVITKIKNAMKSSLQKMQTTLMKPEVKKEGTEQIKKKARTSILEKLNRNRAKIDEREANKKQRTAVKKQDMEL